MPIYLTDGRTGLEIIPKVYEDSILVHYGIKGQKHGIRRWQNEDGSLTPEGYIHYGIGKGRQSDSSKQQYDGSDTVFVSGKVKYDSPLSGRRESEQERKDLQFEKQLRKYDKLSASEQDEVMHEVEKRLEKLRQKKNLTHDERKIEDGLSDWLQTEKEKRKPLEGRDYLDYLMHDKVTNSEVAFDNAVYALSADKSVMNQINKAIHNSKNPLVSEAKTAADEFNKAQKALDDAYDSYSKQWFKDHPGKVFWDGDGTEFHWELEKRYPGYKKISENYEKMVKDFIDKVSKASTISEFRDIKSKNLTNYYDKIFDSNKGVYWYKAANAKAFAIAVAMNGDNARYFIDPMEFIEMFDENWKKFS